MSRSTAACSSARSRTSALAHADHAGGPSSTATCRPRRRRARGLVEPALVAGDERHPRAPFREEPRGGEPDAARSAGHDHVLARQRRSRPDRATIPSLGTVPGVPRRAILLLTTVALVLAGTTDPGPIAAERRGGRCPAFHVQGSVEQVAVTGAEKGATAKLVSTAAEPSPSGRSTARAPPCSATSRRAPATASRSAAPAAPTVTVTSADRHPDPSLYTSQHLDAGFGYIKTRDGTLLSANVQPARAGRGRPLPHRGRVLGLRPVEPRRPPTGVGHRADPRLRDGGREPARHRLLGRGVRLLRTAPVARRLRRDRDRRRAAVGRATARSAWSASRTRASTPALRRRDPASAPRRDHAALGDRRHVPDAVPRRDPERRLRGRWGEGPPGRRAPGGVEVGAGADRQRRHDVRGEPGAAAADPDVLRPRSPSSGHDRVPADDALAPATFVDKINVPVFLAGSWQDEETGGHFPEMLDDFAPGVPVKFTLMNGVHSDSLGPEVITRWAEFLDFYVARRVPTISPAARVLAAACSSRLRTAPASRCPPDRFDPNTDYAAALAAYQAEPPVRVLFDSGAGGPPGAPIAAFETTVRRRGRRRRAPRARGTSSPTARSAPDAPAAATADRLHLRPGGVPRTDAERPRCRRRRTSSPARRRSTGSRCPTARRSPT